MHVPLYTVRLAAAYARIEQLEEWYLAGLRQLEAYQGSCCVM